MTVVSDEQETLEQLLSPAVWGLLHQRFQSQWGRTGDRYCELLEKMANTVGDRTAVVEEMQRVIWLRKEMELFLGYFPERFKALTHATVPGEVEQSRRGML